MLESDVKQLYNDWLVKDFGSMKKIEVWPWIIALCPGPSLHVARGPRFDSRWLPWVLFLPAHLLMLMG